MAVSLFFFLFVTTNSSAQDLRQQKKTQQHRGSGQRKSAKLMQNLGLTTKQTLLVEDKLTEFLIYRKEIHNSKLSQKEKNERFKALDNSKFSEMREILTRQNIRRSAVKTNVSILFRF